MSVKTSKVPNFTFDEIKLQDSGILYVVDIKAITHSLRIYMDKTIGQLAYGRTMELPIVKIKIKAFLATKRNTNQEVGAIAEYFVHLFLSDQGMQPRSLITNLEENSLKKGFDGLYTLAKQEWICESKSGSLNTSGVCHTSKVKEAYQGIDKKISGKEPNNPWDNAMYHARVLNSSKSLVKKLEQLSDQFDSGNFANIGQFNIIPCATIYLDGQNKTFTVEEIETNINKAIKKFKYKDIKVVCITKNSIETFYDYLNS